MLESKESFTKVIDVLCPAYFDDKYQGTLCMLQLFADLQNTFGDDLNVRAGTRDVVGNHAQEDQKGGERHGG